MFMLPMIILMIITKWLNLDLSEQGSDMTKLIMMALFVVLMNAMGFILSYIFGV